MRQRRKGCSNRYKVLQGISRGQRIISKKVNEIPFLTLKILLLNMEEKLYNRASGPRESVHEQDM